MKITIASDFHLGFGKNTEREKDAWEAAKEVLEKSRDSDLILLAGDIFHSRIPRPEVWANALKLFRDGEKVELVDEDKKVSNIVAIHGTHERRGKKLKNPVEGLESAGFLVHLHCDKILFDIGGKKVAVHGMSGVPEAYAKDVLRNWNPKPVEGVYNIFMLHQSIEPYIYNPIDPPSLKLEDLPEGFDLYVCGHVHWPENTEVKGKPFLIPGSTVTTQMNRIESKDSKGYFVVDLDNDEPKVYFEYLKNTRKIFYEKIHDKENLKSFLEDIKSRKLDKRPLVRVKTKLNNDEINSIKSKYEDSMFLNVSKEEKGKKKRGGKVLKAKDVESMGSRILQKELDNKKLPRYYSDLFELFVEGKKDEILEELRKNISFEKSSSDNKPKNLKSYFGG